jgi:hypothetical protein
VARAKTVELTLFGGSKSYVPSSEFESFGVPETAEAIIGAYIAGSKGPLLKVNTLEDMTGEYFYINPKAILSMKVTY